MTGDELPGPVLLRPNEASPSCPRTPTGASLDGSPRFFCILLRDFAAITLRRIFLNNSAIFFKTEGIKN